MEDNLETKTKKRTQNFIGPNNFQNQNLLDPKFFLGPKFFWLAFFLPKIFYRPQIFSEPKCSLDPKCFGPLYLDPACLGLFVTIWAYIWLSLTISEYLGLWMIFRFLKLRGVKKSYIYMYQWSQFPFLRPTTKIAVHFCYNDHIYMQFSLVNSSDIKMVPQNCSYGSAGVPAVPATISMSVGNKSWIWLTSLKYKITALNIACRKL